MIKRYHIVIERYFDASFPRGKRAAPGFRWTVAYRKIGSFHVQGFEDTHGSARNAAEACLREHGVDLDWVTPNAKEKEPKPRWTPVRSP